MKNLSRYGLILLTGILLFCVSLQAQAAGQMTPEKLALAIETNGLDAGIEAGLASGMNLDDILTTAIASGNSNTQIILVAMCVAGANDADLRAAAMAQNISPLIFASALDTCKANNDEKETQAYTPAQTRVTARARNMAPVIPPEPYASPSGF